jgi:hypothetical protein
LTIKPWGWNQTNYEGNYDPFATGSTGTWDPHAEKPIRAQKFAIANCTGSIKIMGLDVFGDATASSDYGFYVDNCRQVTLAYCCSRAWRAGIMAANNSIVNNENSASVLNNIGVVSAYGSYVYLVGMNMFSNNFRYGIVCYNNSVATFRAWALNPGERFGTDIRTSVPRKRYAAIKAMINSSIVIEDPDMKPTLLHEALVSIINECLVQGKEQYGVVLESKSLLVNADHITFSDPSVNEGKPTIPPIRQIVGVGIQDATAIL